MESHELDFKYNLKSLLKRLTGCVPVFLCTYSKKLRTEMKINKYLTTNLIIQFIYDHNSVKRLQVREVMGIGLSLDI